MVIDPTQEMMVMNVISQLVGATMELSSIAKIHKYKRFYEGHHFISMAMEVHDIIRCDMDHFIKEYIRLFHDRQSKDNLSLFFRIQFFKQCVNIVFQCALTSIIERKIVLLINVCFKPPIIIRSHNLHVSNTKGVVGEITSYHEKD
jgi:hypothetical protein